MYRLDSTTISRIVTNCEIRRPNIRAYACCSAVSPLSFLYSVDLGSGQLFATELRDAGRTVSTASSRQTGGRDLLGGQSSPAVSTGGGADDWGGTSALLPGASWEDVFMFGCSYRYGAFRCLCYAIGREFSALDYICNNRTTSGNTVV